MASVLITGAPKDGRPVVNGSMLKGPARMLAWVDKVGP